VSENMKQCEQEKCFQISLCSDKAYFIIRIKQHHYCQIASFY